MHVTYAMLSSRPRRRILLALAATSLLVAAAACSATNGDPIPSQVFDASALDVGTNPDDPAGGEGGVDGEDGSPKKDASSDAPVDAPKDAPNTAPVVINEMFVDNKGFGDAAEFVELRAAPGTRADDLKLRILKPDGKLKYEVTVGPAGAKFDGNGLYAVGGSRLDLLNVGVAGAHVDNEIFVGMWGLDNTLGAVQLIRGSTLLDVVGYARDPDAGAVPPASSPPTATVEGKRAIVPDGPNGNGQWAISFGRKTGAPDTNDNAADFCAMEASPGLAQSPCK